MRGGHTGRFALVSVNTATCKTTHTLTHTPTHYLGSEGGGCSEIPSGCSQICGNARHEALTGLKPQVPVVRC
jgi:hypothetical protein